MIGYAGYAGNFGKSLTDVDPALRKAIVSGSLGQRRQGMSATTLAVAKYFRALRAGGVEAPGDLPVEGEDEDESNGLPKWLLPVGLAAGAGVLVLLLVRMGKKKAKG